MARPVEIGWPGGQHLFALRIGELRALQDACDAGPPEVLSRLAGNRWRLDDVLATVRLGLEGGGMPRAEAQRRVANVADEGSLMRLAVTAQLVLGAALVGVADDPAGELEGVSPSPDAGSSAGSTEPEPWPGSPPATSTP